MFFPVQNIYVARDGNREREFMEGRREEINFENSGCHDNILSSKSGISELVLHGKAGEPRRKELK